MTFVAAFNFMNIAVVKKVKKAGRDLQTCEVREKNGERETDRQRTSEQIHWIQ